MPHLSDVALALQLHAEPRADRPDVTVIHRKAGQNRWRAAFSEEWRRGRCLGEGGYGQVYLEECISGETAGRVRAVKRLHRARNENYYHELNALALFSLGKYRDSFVQCFGWYLTEEHIVLSMEYLPHGDLQQYIEKALPEEEGQLIAIQMLEALDFMHERNFTHRDLKPANLLVSATGPQWWIKVADFGISKRTEEGMTSLRTAMGTQMFAAPEVFLSDDESAYTNAVDIWGAGMVTLLILIGMPNMNFKSILKYAVRPEEPFPYQPLTAQRVSADGQSFVRDLLEREGRNRPSASKCLQHRWLSHANGISQSFGNMAVRRNEIDEQQRTPFHRSVASSDGLAARTQSMMTDPAALTSQSTGSLMPTAQWTTYKSDSSQKFETAFGKIAVGRGADDSLSSTRNSTSSSSDTERRSQKSSGVYEPLSSPTIRAGENRPIDASLRSQATNSTKDVSPDTPIAVKINLDRKLGRIELPFKDLEPDIFISKLRQAIGMPAELSCQFDWFSESTGDFETLDANETGVFHRLVEAACVKNEIYVKATLNPPAESMSSPKPDANKSVDDARHDQFRPSSNGAERQAEEAQRVSDERMQPLGDGEKIEWDVLRRQKALESRERASSKRAEKVPTPPDMARIPDYDTASEPDSLEQRRFEAVRPFEGLKGLRVIQSSNIADDDGNIVGTLIEGDPEKLVGHSVLLSGRVIDNNGILRGRAERRPKGQFWGVEEARVDNSGLVCDKRGNVVGRAVEGNPKDVAGRPVEDDGDILDSRGNVVGRAMKYVTFRDVHDGPSGEKKDPPSWWRRFRKAEEPVKLERKSAKPMKTDFRRSDVGMSQTRDDSNYSVQTQYGMRIYIRNFAGRLISVRANSFDPVLVLKSKIAEREGIHPEQQRLAFEGKRLDDEQSLEHYNIRDGATLELFTTLDARVAEPKSDAKPKSYPKPLLFIKTLTGRTITVDFGSDDTVFDLKTKVFEKDGLPQDRQRLILRGKDLEDKYHLSHYNIWAKDTISLVLRY